MVKFIISLLILAAIGGLGVFFINSGTAKPHQEKQRKKVKLLPEKKISEPKKKQIKTKKLNELKTKQDKPKQIQHKTKTKETMSENNRPQKEMFNVIAKEKPVKSYPKGTTYIVDAIQLRGSKKNILTIDYTVINNSDKEIDKIVEIQCNIKNNNSDDAKSQTLTERETFYVQPYSKVHAKDILIGRTKFFPKIKKCTIKEITGEELMRLKENETKKLEEDFKKKNEQIETEFNLNEILG